MLIKLITLFLVALAVLAMFGRFRPKLRLPGKDKRAGLPPKPRKCPDCGGFVIGKDPCGCRR